MKIAFFEILSSEKEFFTEKLKEHELIFFDGILDEKNVPGIADADAISVFVYSKLNSKIIDGLPDLKLITTRSMGFDHIDVAYARQKGITVCMRQAMGKKPSPNTLLVLF